jgi:hypothetical protein
MNYVDRINLAQDMEQWPAIVKTEMNLRISQNSGNFLTGRASISLSGTLHRVVSFFLVLVFLGWCETESTWYVGH